MYKKQQQQKNTHKISGEAWATHPPKNLKLREYYQIYNIREITPPPPNNLLF